MNFLICEVRVIWYPNSADFFFSSYLTFINRKEYSYFLFSFITGDDGHQIFSHLRIVTSFRNTSSTYSS